MLQQSLNIMSLTAKEIMSKNPKTTDPDVLAIEAFELMKQKKITQLLVCENQKYLGVIHMHDILKEGIV